MQLRSRKAATTIVEITKVLKTKKQSNGIRKKTTTTTTSTTTKKRSIATSVPPPLPAAAEGDHPLEVTSPPTSVSSSSPIHRFGGSKKRVNFTQEKERRHTPSPPDPTLATLTSPTSHRLIHIPHSEHNATFLARASKHLISVDPRFHTLLEKNHCHVYSPEGLAEGVDPFKALVCGILSQQVSGAAARSITRKFVLLFTSPVDDEGNPPKGFFPTPQDVLSKTPEVIRTAGLSGRKVEYVLDLSARFADGRLKAEDMVHDTDEEIIEKLVKVRGIGQWSITPPVNSDPRYQAIGLMVGAEMFLMFALKRPDVLSTGDLGIQRGMAVWAGKNIANAKGKTGKWKYMGEQEMLVEGEKWRPYRSLGAWCMWRVESTNSAPVMP